MTEENLTFFFTYKWSSRVNLSITSYEYLLYGSILYILSTYIEGTWISYGFNLPAYTTYYTSAIVILAAAAMSALKLRAVLWNWRLPKVSALFAFIKAKSPWIEPYYKYFIPLKFLVGLASATI